MVAAEASSPLEARSNLRGKCLAEYIFLGGSGGDLRSRTRVLGHVPASAAECPLWTVDGTYTDQVRKTSIRIVPYFMGACALHRPPHTRMGMGTRVHDRHDGLLAGRPWTDCDTDCRP